MNHNKNHSQFQTNNANNVTNTIDESNLLDLSKSILSRYSSQNYATKTSEKKNYGHYKKQS